MIEVDGRTGLERERECWIEEGRVAFERAHEAGVHHSDAAWVIGDWANRYNRGYGDLRLAVESLGASYGHVKVRAHVARRFDPSRRRPGLSFGHHQAAASLDDEVADRLLAEAELKNWSRDEMRDAVREVGPEAAQRRRADKLQAEVDRLKAEAALSVEDAEMIIADVERTGEALMKDAVRAMTLYAEHLESQRFTKARGTLHGNADRGLSRRLERAWRRFAGEDLKEIADRVGRVIANADGNVEPEPDGAPNAGADGDAGKAGVSKSYAPRNSRKKDAP